MKELDEMINRSIKIVILALLVAFPAFAQESTEKPTGKQYLTSDDVIKALIKAGLPIEESVVYTEETDPNKLLGRPGQYNGKASWHDQRDGRKAVELDYTVEIFSSTEDLERRRKYIEVISRSASVFAQYLFVHKNALLRLHHNLTPKQAAEYEKVLKSL